MLLGLNLRIGIQVGAVIMKLVKGIYIRDSCALDTRRFENRFFALPGQVEPDGSDKYSDSLAKGLSFVG